MDAFLGRWHWPCLGFLRIERGVRRRSRPHREGGRLPAFGRSPVRVLPSLRRRALAEASRPLLLRSRSAFCQPPSQRKTSICVVPRTGPARGQRLRYRRRLYRRDERYRASGVRIHWRSTARRRCRATPRQYRGSIFQTRCRTRQPCERPVARKQLTCLARDGQPEVFCRP